MNDLISRQAAIEHLKKRLYETALNNDTEHPYYEEMADNRVSVWLEEVPTIDPVKHGKWKETGDKGGRNYACDCCRFTFIMDTCMGEPMWNYCPNCGARMESKE